MKNSDVVWSDVKKECEKCTCEIDGKKYDIKYEVLEYICDQDEMTYYKVIVFVPFSFESTWRLTKNDEWNDKVVVDIKRYLVNRYKDIKKRHNIAKKLNCFFAQTISREKLFHAPLHEVVGDKYVGDYVQKYEEYKVENIELEACETEEKVLDEVVFKRLLLNGKCEYCGISIKEINQLSKEGKLHTKRARGYSMEIDQKDPNGLYTDENCVASCYWCNNAKTDEFTVEEFKEIAKGINGIWKQRLREANLPDKIDFPTEVYEGEDK